MSKSIGRDDLTINFILENSTYFGDALRVFNDIKKRAHEHAPELERLLGTVIPGGKMVRGLQAADALATGALQLERRADPALISSPIPEDAVLADLQRRISPRAAAIRMHPTAKQLRDLKDAAEELRAHKGRHWEKRQAERAAMLSPKVDESEDGRIFLDARSNASGSSPASTSRANSRKRLYCSGLSALRFRVFGSAFVFGLVAIEREPQLHRLPIWRIRHQRSRRMGFLRLLDESFDRSSACQ